VITATFVPFDSELYEETTATPFVPVRYAPLLLTANDAQKFYLDPLPQFTYTATGFVNGEDASILLGTPTFHTPATASDVGAYPIFFADVPGSDRYKIALRSGQLTVVPRPTRTALAPPRRVHPRTDRR
jgi:hypothetical protein